jgi:hypothetical protein
MAKQPHLPGIPARTTAADIKALVAARLVGFELRQEERARRRAERPRPAAGDGTPPAQLGLLGDAGQD